MENSPRVAPNGPYVVPLGIAAALTGEGQANSYLAVVQAGQYWLVDCADNPIAHLQKAGLDPLNVQGVLITHFHPDHIYGLPVYLLGLFILAFQKGMLWERPLPIYARSEVLPLIQQLLGLFTSQGWLDTLPIVYREVKAEADALVAEEGDFIVSAAPAEHSVPSLAVKFLLRGTERAFVYSSDTQPCAAVEHLARGATLLFHEATDSDSGHTRPAAAGALAARAEAARLVLIHYYPDPDNMAHILSEARKTFAGPVELATAFQRYFW